jgi:hypothetical protein
MYLIRDLAATYDVRLRRIGLLPCPWSYPNLRGSKYPWFCNCSLECGSGFHLATLERVLVIDPLKSKAVKGSN